ncbi:type IV secretory system conjugative DNA transfer family protein [Pseudomonas luteola]
MASRETRGVTKNQDLDPSLINPDVRPFKARFRELMANNGGFVFAIAAIIIAFYPVLANLPQIYDILSVFMILMWFRYRKDKREYPYKKPMPVKDGKPVFNDDAGMFFLGNDLTDDSGIYFSNSDMRTHMLVFGSTGSGKSRFLLGILYQAMLVGSGAMMVDGKGDTTIFWLVYSMCRRLNRIDSLLVINYLTGGEESGNSGSRDFNRLTNTSNPMAYGTAEALRSLIVGLMRESGGDGEMWKGRASMMLKGLLKALVYMRDKGRLNLDIERIRDYMPLDRMIELTNDDTIPDRAKNQIKKYLLELPGYSDDDAMIGQINGEAYKQHNFLTMQLSEVMSDLSDTYGHIFKAPLGEVDFKDVIYNGRLLFVMLPALEKDPDALAGLGKLVVSGVRSALAPALGNKIEGYKVEVIDKKPTNAKVPFLIILDEYGYYSVKGFSVVAAQARSLGVSVIFAGQDFPSFKKGSEDEAKSCVANTNIKICMKLEDAKDTFDIVESRAGSGTVGVSSGHEQTGNVVGNDFKGQTTTRVEVRKRIDILDLVSQAPGAAHVVFADVLTRVQLVYIDPVQTDEAHINHFLMVEINQDEIRRNVQKTFEKLDEIFKEGKIPGTEKVNVDESLMFLSRDLRTALDKKESVQESVQIALGMMVIRQQAKDMDITDKVGKLQQKEATKVVSIGTADSVVADDEDTNKRIQSEILAVMNQDVGVSVANDARAISERYEAILTGVVEKNLERHMGRPLSQFEKATVAPRQHLRQLERLATTSESMVDSEAGRAIDIISRETEYPTDPKPQKMTEGSIDETVRQLLKAVDKSKL